jgi:hypothetical protein
MRNYLKNFLGYRTKRKIVVIESDDWGSIRTKDKCAYEKMLIKGLDVDKNPFTRFDSLESNDDLIHLFEILMKYKDINGRYANMTPMYIMANPNFNAIRANDYTKFEFETFTETYKKYPNHDRVADLIQEGIRERIFQPELHGREHVNAPRWMRLLQDVNSVARISFDNESIGAMALHGKLSSPYLNTFNAEFPEDFSYIQENLTDAVKLFSDSFGYSPSHFIEPNEFGPMEIERILSDLGINYILRAKFTRYSKYNNLQTRRYLHWLGKRNNWNQIYLTRNCTFEPHMTLNSGDVVGLCLKEIAYAFYMNKPAIIISHRASYIGSISELNRKFGLMNLNLLLKSILKYWPDVEFLSSKELGNIIRNSSN